MVKVLLRYASTDGSLLGLIGGGSAGQFNVGFWTTQSFDEVRFRLSQPVGIGLGGETRVYSALLEQAAAGPTPTCNGDQGTSWTKPTYPVRVSESNTGISGICVGCEVTGASNIIDSNASNYANINILAGLLASGSVSVVDPLVGSYPGGTFAGFSVEDTGGLGGSLLNAFTLTTYLNGVQQESVGSGSLFDLPVFVGKHVVGFKTTQPFNEVKLSAGSLAGLNTNVHIYEAILAPDGCFTPYLNNSPIITSNGGGNSATINVAENTTAVTTISASDSDGDPLTYSISGGADAAKFSINASTGVLTFISAPDYENPTDSGANNVYDVQVTVSDGTASDTQTIAVTVTDVADSLDYSDAPSSYGTPAHNIVAGLYLGTTPPDSENNAQPNPTASGDDAAGSDDEDAVFTDAGLTTSLQAQTLTLEQNIKLHIPVTGTGNLYAWFDWDGDGVFGNHPDELVVEGVSVANQTYSETVIVPLYAKLGTTYARFRLSSDTSASSPTGLATDGEVEDYQVQIAQPASSTNPPSAVAPATCSATGTSSSWTAGGGGYQTTTAQGLVITAIGTAPSGANWSFTPNDVMNTVGDFGNPGINGTRSLGTVFYWDTTPESGRTANASTDGKTGTLTFNFSSLVHDPIIYIDRMGGYGGKSSATPKLLSSSARITPNAANAGITFTKVGGGTHFEVTANSIQRTPNQAMVWGESTGEAGADSTRQMAMGGVQILGSYNSLSFDLVGTGVEGAGGDGMEFVICADASSNAAPVITSNGGGSTAALTLSEGSSAVTTVTATDANAGDTLTYSITGGADAAQFSINATTGVLTFNSAPSYSSPTDANSDNVYEVQVTVNDGNGGTDTQALAVTITQTNSKVLEYTIRRGVDGRYHVYMRPTSTPTNNLNLTGQITLTVPTGSGANRFLINDLQSTVGSVTWALNSRVDAPTENTAQDYLSFTFTPLGNGNFNWQAGLEIEVFNFINPNTCTGLVDVMDDTDPFNIPTNSAGSVPANQFTNTGWGATTDNNYLGNYGSPVDCSTANNPPVITSDGGGATAALSVADGATTATAVSATDADNHTLTYSISGGADAAKFTINPTTGLLSFVNPANYGSNFLLDPPEDSDGNNIYEVTVTVNDGHGGTDTQAISITVTSSPLLGLQLQVRVLLQGAYNSSTGLMNNTLAQLGLLPTVQPYTGLVGSLGLETVTSGVLNLLGNDAPVDWVLLEIRSASNPATVLLSIPSILQRDGDVINPATGSSLLSVTGLVLGSYHVSIRHRNHLGIITSTPVSLLSGSSTLVDFSVGSVGVGSSTRLTTSTGKTLLWAGDATTDDRAIANGPDNDVSPILSDVLLVPANTTLNANYIKSGYAKTDLNMDGKTIFAGPNNDINLLAGNVLIHPTNSTFSGNYVINGVIPK